MGHRRRYTDEQLIEAATGSRTIRGVLIALDLVPAGGNYENVRRRIKTIPVDATHLERRRRPRLTASDDELQSAVAESKSFAEVLRRLGHEPGGRLQASLTRRVLALGLDVSHFIGQGWRRGSRVPVTPAIPLSELLVDGRPYSTSKLKRRLLAAGLKEARCEAYGGEEWAGQRIPLELDHVNGSRDDNRLSNLRLLCPNCHALTSTYRGRNIGTDDIL